ncbi:MAG: hypothetical protein IKK08_07695 [Clostridia bacterium]|nr:hypothetical protein [Clostridia bacterium]
MNKAQKFLAMALAAAMLLITMLTGANAECVGERLYVNGMDADKVHFRSEPYMGSASLGLLYSGTEVILLSLEYGDWYYVQIGTETGYINANYLSHSQPESKAPTAYVYNPNSSWVHLRRGAGTQTQSVGRVNNNDVVYVLGELSNGWTYVQRGSQSGFMASNFLRSSANGQTGSNNGFQNGLQSNRIELRNPMLEKVGYAANGDGIFRLIAPDNGQTLFFTSMEEYPSVYQEDVNFDGAMDLVVVTARGTSNEFCAFFVRTDATYEYVQVPQLENGLCSYVLYPQQKLVLSRSNNGAAGAYHETAVFRWEGNQLKILRRSCGEMAVDRYEQNGMMISASNPQLLLLTVWDYASNPSEGTLVYENKVLLAAAQDNLTYQEAAFWQGIR